MKKRVALFLPILAAAGIVLTSLPVDAFLIVTASRRFPGSACVKVSSGGLLQVTGDDGAIYNSENFGGANLTVDCPVLSNGSNITTAPAATLWYVDDSTSSISCTYKAEDQLTSAVNQQTVTSTGNGFSYQSMTFNVNTFTDGFVHIRCTIPPRDSAGNPSYLVGYSGW